MQALSQRGESLGHLFMFVTCPPVFLCFFHRQGHRKSLGPEYYVRRVIESCNYVQCPSQWPLNSVEVRCRCHLSAAHRQTGDRKDFILVGTYYSGPG